MREITDITTFTTQQPTVLTIGTFDGVHLGHQKIVERVVTTARQEGLLATVFTFFSASANGGTTRQRLETHPHFRRKKNNYSSN